MEADNKNINCVIIRNLTEDEEVNIEKYLPMAVDTAANESNTNVNLIIIQNIISSRYIKPDVQMKNSLPDSEDGKMLQMKNKNINVMVIKNIIPLRK